MAIHDFGYRSYDGQRTGALARMYAIARSDVVQFFKTKKSLIFFLVCLSPAIMAFVFVYLRFIVFEGQGQLMGLENARNRGGGFMARGPFGRGIEQVEFYVDFGKGMTTLLTIIFSARVGADVIAKDRSVGALEVYFTRGIRPAQYLTAKWLGVTFLLMCQVLFPFVAVWLFAVAVAPADSGFFTTTSAFMPRVVLAQTFLCATLGLVATALSTSTDSPRFALLRWAGGMFLLIAASNILYRMFHEANWFVVSPWHTTRRLAAALADAPHKFGFDLGPAMIAWAVMIAASLAWIRRHLRPVEVVG